MGHWKTNNNDVRDENGVITEVKMKSKSDFNKLGDSLTIWLRKEGSMRRNTDLI